MDQETKAKDFISSFISSTPEQRTELEKKPSEVYRDITLLSLPLGRLYNPSTRIEIRSLDLGEILNYSTLETNDIDQVRPKLDEILEKCVRVTMFKQKLNYKTLFVQDRLYLIYMIRELTFQSGRILTRPVTCSCKTSFDIELIRQNIEMWSNDEEIWKYFKPEFGCFSFETTIKPEPFNMRPITIGLQQSYLNWIQERKYKNLEVNDAFVKITPYMVNATELSYDDITTLQDEFLENLKNSKTGEEEFQFLNDCVDNFKKNEFHLGIKGLVKKCPKCGMEVRTNSVFPNRVRDLFVVPNAFRSYLKK